MQSGNEVNFFLPTWKINAIDQFARITNMNDLVPITAPFKTIVLVLVVYDISNVIGVPSSPLMGAMQKILGESEALTEVQSTTSINK